MASSPEYRELLQKIRELSTLEQAASLLSWDEQTNMPKGAATDRAKQKAMLSGIIHERLTSQGMGKLIKTLKKQELSPDGKVIVRETERKWKRASSIPADLVKEMTITQSLALEAWEKARHKNSFELMKPSLEKIISLKFQEAEHVGYEQYPYDALLDDFEPGLKSKDVDVVFSRFKAKLVSAGIEDSQPACAGERNCR